jgi:hypothetical protein
MTYSKVPISEDTLRDACSRSYDWDGTNSIIFLRKKDGKRLEGIVRDILPKKLVLLFLAKKGGKVQLKLVEYKDISNWVVLSKVEIAREYQRLASIIENSGKDLDE